MNKNTNMPKIGVAIFLIRADGKTLLGKRTGSHGANTWNCPGGHLDFNEKIKKCAIRELEEETGIKIDENKVQICNFTEDFFIEENKHYITIFTKTIIADDTAAKIMEPNKCLEWKWFGLDELNNIKLFLPIKNLVRLGLLPKELF